MSAAVVRNDIEAAWLETLNDADGTGAVIRDSVKVNECPPAIPRTALPALERDFLTAEDHFVAGIRRGYRDTMANGIEQTASAKHR
jgi:hypothetical protein